MLTARGAVGVAGLTAFLMVIMHVFKGGISLVFDHHVVNDNSRYHDVLKIIIVPKAPSIFDNSKACL